MKNFLFLILFVLTLTFSLSAQSNKSSLPNSGVTPRNPPPGGIELLSGYVNLKSQGIDTLVGEIKKTGGITIHYDIGESAGFYTDYCRFEGNCLWSKVQKINGREVRIGLTAAQLIIVTFPQDSANFYAETTSPENIADFLLMILTYKVSQPIQDSFNNNLN